MQSNAVFIQYARHQSTQFKCIFGQFIKSLWNKSFTQVLQGKYFLGNCFSCHFRASFMPFSCRFFVPYWYSPSVCLDKRESELKFICQTNPLRVKQNQLDVNLSESISKNGEFVRFFHTQGCHSKSKKRQTKLTFEPILMVLTVVYQ